MNGFVDEQLRAFLRMPVLASRDGERPDRLVWIDTPQTDLFRLALLLR